MAHEIERRFLVRPGCDPAAEAASSVLIGQSYLRGTGDWVMRVRRIVGPDGALHLLTLKKPLSPATNEEHEVPISPEAYADIVRSCGPELLKTRHLIPYAGRVWEVDVFHDERANPRMIAEVELPAEDAGLIVPRWADVEVTGERAFSNVAIAARLERLDGQTS